MFDLTFRVRQSFGDLAGGLGARRSSDDPRGQTTELDPQVGESLRPRGRRFYRRFGSGAAYGLAAAASGRRSSENSADARQTFSRRLREYAYSYIFPPYFEKRDPNQLEKSEERWSDYMVKNGETVFATRVRFLSFSRLHIGASSRRSETKMKSLSMVQ